jgi:hypothetical protein
MALSKPLGKDDESGFAFAKEMLQGDSTYAINFDRLQKHPKHGYIIFEFLLCEEEQPVNPHTSHPSRYWHLNAQKFISLFEVAQALNATLYLVNYAKLGTKHEDKIRVIKVKNVDETGITDQESHNLTRAEFSKRFRKLNKDCSLTS